MFKPILSIIIICLIASFIVSDESLAQTQTNNQPRVFILHSYEKDHVCGKPQRDGVIAALHDAGFDHGTNLTVREYHMDTKKINNTPELIEKQAKIALEQINEFKPDVLVTLDDNAFRTVALKFVDTEMAIVFSGMNGQPAGYNSQTPCIESREKPGHNITGVYEKLHIVDAIRVHSRIFPGHNKLKIIVDHSPTGKAISSAARRMSSGITIPSCRARIRLNARAYFCASSIGISDGFSPCNTLVVIFPT